MTTESAVASASLAPAVSHPPPASTASESTPPHCAAAGAPPRTMRPRGVGAQLALALLLLAAIPAAMAQLMVDRAVPTALDLSMQSVMRELGGAAVVRAVGVATHVGGMPGTLVVAAVLGAALLLARRWRHGLGLLGLVLAIGTVLRVVKPLVARERPLEPLIVETGFSFPSGHALATAALWGYLAWLVSSASPDPRWRRTVYLLSAVVPLVTGLGRLLLNVHWLTDVIAGWSIGVGLALLTIAAVGRAGGGTDA